MTQEELLAQTTELTQEELLGVVGGNVIPQQHLRWVGRTVPYIVDYSLSEVVAISVKGLIS